MAKDRVGRPRLAACVDRRRTLRGGSYRNLHFRCRSVEMTLIVLQIEDLIERIVPRLSKSKLEKSNHVCHHPPTHGLFKIWKARIPIFSLEGPPSLKASFSSVRSALFDRFDDAVAVGIRLNLQIQAMIRITDGIGTVRCSICRF